MKCFRFSPWIAVLIVTIALLRPARAEFGGGILGDRPWTIMVTNDSLERTAVTVYYVTRTVEVIELITVPANQTDSFLLPKPGKAERIIIEVDPPGGGSGSIHFNGASMRFESVRPGDTFRLVLDVL